VVPPDAWAVVARLVLLGGNQALPLDEPRRVIPGRALRVASVAAALEVHPVVRPKLAQLDAVALRALLAKGE
jgi:hypothetical protein